MPRNAPPENPKRTALKDKMRDLMIECARKKTTITYSELSRELLGAGFHVHYHSSHMIRLLNEIGEAEVQAGRGVLPAVVVLKGSGIPGGGYFANTEWADASTDDLRAIWEKDVNELYDYWESH